MTNVANRGQSAAPTARTYEHLADEANRQNKGAIFDALSEARIHTVIVTFDGYADSGQIESVDPFDAANEAAALPEQRQVRLVTAKWEDLKLHSAEMPLREGIELLVYEYLEATHMGWEDGEGAYGTFVFTVPERTLTLEHHTRFVDVETSTHEF